MVLKSQLFHSGFRSLCPSGGELCCTHSWAAGRARVSDRRLRERQWTPAAWASPDQTATRWNRHSCSWLSFLEFAAEPLAFFFFFICYKCSKIICWIFTCVCCDTAILMHSFVVILSCPKCPLKQLTRVNSPFPQRVRPKSWRRCWLRRTSGRWAWAVPVSRWPTCWWRGPRCWKGWRLLRGDWKVRVSLETRWKATTR